MRRLNILLVPLLTLVWTVAVAGANTTQLFGVWKIQSASIPMPKTCSKLSLQFLADGTYIGDDGSMVMRMKFDAVEDADGLTLIFSQNASIDGHENCQGLPLEYVRQHPPRNSLVRFDDNAKTMHLYFGPTEQSPYLVLMKQD